MCKSREIGSVSCEKTNFRKKFLESVRFYLNLIWKLGNYFLPDKILLSAIVKFEFTAILSLTNQLS